MEHRKPKQWRSEKYLAYVRGLPCCRCGLASPSDPHHIRKGADGGTGLKPSDSWALPVCQKCHGIMQRYEADEGRSDMLALRYRQCIQNLTDFLGGRNHER